MSLEWLWIQKIKRSIQISYSVMSIAVKHLYWKSKNAAVRGITDLWLLHFHGDKSSNLDQTYEKCLKNWLIFKNVKLFNFLFWAISNVFASFYSYYVNHPEAINVVSVHRRWSFNLKNMFNLKVQHVNRNKKNVYMYIWPYIKIKMGDCSILGTLTIRVC